MKGCRPLSDPEIALVSRSFGGTYAARDRALFLLGIKTGFRIAELLSLRVGDVLQHGQLVDQLTVRRAHMKRQREGRTVPKPRHDLRYTCVHLSRPYPEYLNSNNTNCCVELN